jgi:hypothetical protein
MSATNSLSVNKFYSFSCKQLYDNSYKQFLKKEIDNNIPIFNIRDDTNQIYGSHLDIDFAFEN